MLSLGGMELLGMKHLWSMVVQNSNTFALWSAVGLGKISGGLRKDNDSFLVSKIMLIAVRNHSVADDKSFVFSHLW